MSKDLSHITTAQLERDLRESIEDIETCQMALLQGVTQYSGGSVAERRDTNKRMVEVICGELRRREGVVTEAS